VPTPFEIIAFVEEQVGHKLYDEEGLQHGRGDRPVQCALVCWMATAEALERAAEVGAELVIGHETLYYPYDAINRPDAPEGWQDWQVNRRRRELLEACGASFVRLHGALDQLCVYDDFAEVLGLGEPVEADGLAKVFQVEPCSLADLADRVKARTGMAHVRVSAPRGMDQRVSRIGLPWGGLGLFTNVGYQQRLLELGCDALIAGEACSYGFRFSAECGVPMIETSHEGSENPGLRRFCDILGERFPELSVEFFEVRRPWRWL
jgi:putative NIF3 family GTP cyclohydrolase 1 type 2